jgi:hypothetical protein
VRLAKEDGKVAIDDEFITKKEFEAILAKHADAICFRCKVRLRDHADADHFFFESEDEMPDEENN